MPLPLLVPIAIGAGVQGIRMAAPKVAQMLMKQGFKKVPQKTMKGLDKTPSRISQSDAMKLDVHSVTKSGKPVPVPKSKTQKKLSKAVEAAKKEDAVKVAAKPKNKSMTRPEKIVRVAMGQGEKGRRTGTALRNKKNIVSKVLGRKPGTVAGVSKKDQNIAKGVRTGTGAAIAAATIGASMSGGDKSYKIKSGDTLSQIAKKSGTTLKALLAANPGIKDPNKIGVGQEIKLSSPAENRKSVYQDMTKKEMADMQMPKRKGGKIMYKKHGGKVGGSDGNSLVASCYD